ncbi:MAG: stage V sporulation protein AD [Clostridiales bacterium]|nr:stage V sporulation protein AD [Clostridiales bacterium]
MDKKIGSASFILPSLPRIVSSAAFVGKKEGEGPLGNRFDVVCRDDTLGLESWEQAESRMLESAVRLALRKIDKEPKDIDHFMGGDLLSQIISAGFAARELQTPFIGVYGACSTMAESLITSAMLTDGGFSSLSVCGASSHFSSSEREFRYPLEMGTQSPPTAQRTVTGAAAAVLASSKNKLKDVQYGNLVISGGTIGRVRDYGITDASNMGAAMAPAAASTICANLEDFGVPPDYYDLIVTGDLGSFGSEMMYELCRSKGYDVRVNHFDCGKEIYSEDQKVICGGSGCGCCASVLSAKLLPELNAGDYDRILFVATGALLSPLSSLQGESIPSIAHAAVIERRAL